MAPGWSPAFNDLTSAVETTYYPFLRYYLRARLLLFNMRPKRRRMNVPINATYVLPSVSTMFLPTSLVLDENIVIDVR